MTSLLIVDDETHLAQHLQRFFESRGHEVRLAGTSAAGLSEARARHFDVALLDLMLPDGSGLDLLSELKQLAPDTGVVMLTGYGDVETAVKAIQLKADNFILKPVDLPALEAIIEDVVHRYKSADEVVYIKGNPNDLHVTHKARRLLLPPDVIKSLRLLAANPQTCALILGETGTGKGMVANAIHELSERREFPFVDINCAGLNEALLESELMGHERGAFTDAKTVKRGLLEIADKGTLFLDEVGELTLPVQAKLLKVIEERTFRRVGGTQNLTGAVRIIAATNTQLEQAVKAGRFRSDLYFRLNVIPLTLPPLRKRREEIVPLANLFLQEFAGTLRKPGLCLAPEAETLLTFYAWPGNIRELRNVVERAALLCEDEVVRPAHLPGNLRSRQTGTQPILEDGDRRLEAVEARHIKTVLASCQGNRSRTAEILGIHRATLIKKIRQYQLDET